jgi:tetratricopeptide (TPR) repeat protein
MKILMTLLTCLMLTMLHASEASSNLTEMTALYHQGEFDGALSVYAHILKQTNPPPAEVQFTFFRILLAQGKQDSAQRVMREYVKRKPTDYRPWFEWGVVRTRWCGGPRAVAPLRKAIELNPHHAPSYLWLAQTVVPKKDKIQALHKVLELEDRNSPTAKKAVAILNEIKTRDRTTKASTVTNQPALRTD